MSGAFLRIPGSLARAVGGGRRVGGGLSFVSDSNIFLQNKVFGVRGVGESIVAGILCFGVLSSEAVIHICPPERGVSGGILWVSRIRSLNV